MYARFVLFTLGNGKRDVAEGMAKKQQSAMQGLKGFKGASFIADESTGEYGIMSLWESKENAQAAEVTLTPGYLQALKGHLKRIPMRRVLEVFHPNGK
jgi:heme-degrading monooxygenase HmoA